MRLLLALLLACTLCAPAALADSVTLSVTVVGFPACSDGIDNDGDTLIDFPNDPQCLGANDTSEASLSGGGGGGGGGGGDDEGDTTAVFRGKGYPGSKVTILKDAQVAASTVASPDGNFDVTVKRLAAGTYTFSVYGTDKRGIRSATHTFTVSLTNGVTNVITGIFLPPTMSLNKEEVRFGDVIVMLGTTNPSSEITIFVNSAHEVVKKLFADTRGAWLLNFDTTEVGYGEHVTQSRASKGGEISPLSQALGFTVSDKNVLLDEPGPAIAITGDGNGDGRVNLVDFSVMAYWYRRSNPPPIADLNDDGETNIVDFSIMAYNWTG